MYWKVRRGSKTIYAREVIELDIETSWNHDEEDPITWMSSAQVFFNYKYYLFRKPSELMKFFRKVHDDYGLSEDKRIVVAIHNASFDLSYLISYIQREFVEFESDGIFDAPHKIICYRHGGFEFRCTYRLTGASLARWSNEMNVHHKKQVGLYDYNKIIFQDSELSSDEETYDKYDVLSLHESLLKQLQNYNDDITTVPYTSTGYVRRVLRKSCELDRYYWENYFKKNRLDVTSYKMTLNAYAGGYTHVNRFKADELIRVPEGKKGKHKDFRSHYPTQLMCYPLPFGKPILFYDVEKAYNRINGCDIGKILSLSPEYYSLTKLKIYNMRLRDPKCSMPFMQISKMYERDEITSSGMLEDNGRLLALTQGSFITYCDNYTLEILNEQYEFEYIIMRVYIFKNMKLPECLATPINEAFKGKSDYKIEHKRCEAEFGEFDLRTYDAAFNLMRSKRLLNGIYGCLAMNPIRTSYTVDTLGEGDFFRVKDKPQTDEELGAALDKYYKSRKNFLPYQVGCAVTSLARYELYQYIKVIGYENVLYCDTDSIFYIGDDEIESRVLALNAEKAKTASYITNIKGERIQYDVFEDEADFKAFKGLHAKCYGVVTDKEELKITVAGVPEKTLIKMKDGKPIYYTREQELAGVSKKSVIEGKPKSFDPYKVLDRLTEGIIFHTNAGVTCKYIEHEPRIEVVEDHEVETAGGCIIIPLKSKEIHNIDLVLGFDFDYEYRPVEGVADIN